MADRRIVINASRYCDIPCHHADWMAEKVHSEKVGIRLDDKILQISFRPDTVLGPVFWTKNPLPFFEYLELFKDFSYYFQFTITGYGPEMEPGLPDKEKVIVPAFQRLADMIGPNRVVWRYDPVIVSPQYDFNYHVEHFGHLAELLRDSTSECIIGFLAEYPQVLKSLSECGINQQQSEPGIELVKALTREASLNHIQLESCSLELDASEFGVTHAKCVDDAKFEDITGQKLQLDHLRKEAGCIAAIDIGWCEQCPTGCKYCFAQSDSYGI